MKGVFKAAFSHSGDVVAVAAPQSALGVPAAQIATATDAKMPGEKMPSATGGIKAAATSCLDSLMAPSPGTTWRTQSKRPANH